MGATAAEMATINAQNDRTHVTGNEADLHKLLTCNMLTKQRCSMGVSSISS